VQYNFQSISIALITMSATVCTLDDDKCKDGDQATWVKSTASAVVFAGAVCGQLSMGYAGDVFGRNVALIMTLAMVGISAIVSATPTGSPSTIYTVIIIARFFLGFGAGGVYPLSATKAAEDGHGGGGDSVNVIAASKSFFWQVPGTMGPWFLAMIFAYAGGLSADTQWRLLLALGAVPALTVVVLTGLEQRLANNIDEYESLTLNIPIEDGPLLNERQTNIIGNLEDDKPVPFTWELFQDLLATGGGWFIYDIAYCEFFFPFFIFLKSSNFIH
jgi:PHS family inorganic phosphate transporter-like MFS transporter